MPFNYKLLRLSFKTPVRFGNGRGASGLDTRKMTLPSDSLFSTIFIQYLSFYGENKADELIKAFENGNMSITSLLPWKKEGDTISYYIPKPILPGTKHFNPDNIKKQLKKIQYISLNNLSRFIDFINGKAGLGNEQDWDVGIGAEFITDRVNLTKEIPEPYRVASYRFVENSGLYFVLRFSDSSLSDSFVKSVELLGMSGIGGKTSSGLGKYTLDISDMNTSDQEKLLRDMLEDDKARVQLLLGAFHPKEDEIEKLKHEGYSYILEKREGFCTSPSFSSDTGALKRKSCVMVIEGSCFAQRLDGTILDLSYGSFHKVYRLGKTLYAGVNI